MSDSDLLEGEITASHLAAATLAEQPKPDRPGTSIMGCPPPSPIPGRLPGSPDIPESPIPGAPGKEGPAKK